MLSNNTRDVIANATLCLLSILTGIVTWHFYMANFHGSGWVWYDNIPFPVSEKTYFTGETVEYYSIYWQKKDAEKRVTRTLKSACGDMYEYPPVLFSNAGETGKWEWWEKSVHIPDWFSDCDRAWVSGTTTYFPNKWRDVSIPWKTQEFEIINKK